MSVKMARILSALFFIGFFVPPTVADTLNTTVNQQSNGGAWNALGTFSFQAGNAGYVRITNTGTNGYVIADAVRWTRDSVDIILDNSDARGVQTTGAWAVSTSTPGYYGVNYLHDANAGQGTKSVRYAPFLPQSGDYTVSLRWTENANRASNVPVTVVYNVASPRRTLTVADGTGDGDYFFGEEVAITADLPPLGKVFDHWVSGNGGTFGMASASMTTFLMPDNDVIVIATYRDPIIPVIRESARPLPLAYSVDIVVAGGNLAGLAAAIKAAELGADVLIVTSGPSFCTELSDPSRYWLGPDEMPAPGFEQDLFDVRTNPSGYVFISPGRYKKRIEEKLVQNGVRFLYWTTAVGVLEDGSGNLAGVVIANKAGRQAVRANVVIDATPMAGVAQLANAPMTVWPSGNQNVSCTKMMPVSDAEGTAIVNYSTTGQLREYPLSVHFESGSWPERCAAEQQLRSAYPRPAAAWVSHAMHLLGPQRIVSPVVDSSDPWIGAQNLDLQCCRPEGVARLYVVSAASGVARANAEKLIRPLELIRLGARVGAQAHSDAGLVPSPGPVTVKASQGTAYQAGLDVSEALQGSRPYHSYPTVNSSANDVPVWGEYDVVVVGGGTAGAPAAIAAARKGARVLLIEALGILGGTGTNGIGRFWMGYRHGFAMEFNNKIEWQSVEKSEWLFSEFASRGGDVWFNTLACGVVKSNSQVRGVVVATPMGRGAVLGKVIIDATGDGDISYWAGADVLYLNDGDLAIQEASFMGDAAAPTNYANEFNSIFTDPSDIPGMTYFAYLSRKYGQEAGSFDFYGLVGIRETRLIVGDYVVTALDQRIRRTYRDLIAVASSDFDMHGYASSATCMAGLFPEQTNYIPYRALLPRGLDNLLVTGRCKSVTHDALPLARMQPDLQNEGYAAGYIAAKCIQDGVALRNVDIGAVQDHLVSIGNMTATDRATRCVDLAEPADVELQTAAANPAGDSLATLMRTPLRALPFLRASFLAAPTQDKAKALCLMEDTLGAAFLAAWIDTQSLGAGVSYSYTLRNTPAIDGILWAMGLARHPCAVPVLGAKLDTLTYDDVWNTHFTHVRALLTALGRIGDPAAAPYLKRFLDRTAMSGNVKDILDPAPGTRTSMLKSIVELHAATALYRCGDPEGVGKSILQDYFANDWRGIFVRYAGHILGADTGGSTAVHRVIPQRPPVSLRVFPNPFNPQTQITIASDRSIPMGALRVCIYDINGKLVQRLNTAERPPIAGKDLRIIRLTWNGRDHLDRAVASGLYVVKAELGTQRLSRRILCVK
ncbi:MAG: FAD-dependent oxidoreductase [Fibrobacterota bacterium]